jgi:hypothetical protein
MIPEKALPFSVKIVLAAAISALSAWVLASAGDAGAPEGPAQFHMCYRGREFFVYTDPRTGGQAVAMSFDITRQGYMPRGCEGTPEELRRNERGGS